MPRRARVEADAALGSAVAAAALTRPRRCLYARAMSTTSKLLAGGAAVAIAAAAALTIHDVRAAVAPAAAPAVPPGTVILFAGATCPAGFLPANGQAYPAAAERALHAAIGSTWDTAHGAPAPAAGEFRVPNLLGVFPRFLNDGSGNLPQYAPPDAGRKLGEAQAQATAAPSAPFTVAPGGAHSHHLAEVLTWNERDQAPEPDGSFRHYNAQSGGGAFGYGLQRGTRSNFGDRSRDDGAHGHALSGGDAETRPVNVALLGCIKR